MSHQNLIASATETIYLPSVVISLIKAYAVSWLAQCFSGLLWHPVNSSASRQQDTDAKHDAPARIGYAGQDQLYYWLVIFLTIH